MNSKNEIKWDIWIFVGIVAIAVSGVYLWTIGLTTIGWIFLIAGIVGSVAAVIRELRNPMATKGPLSPPRTKSARSQ
ncbi:hypothetical protein A3G63_02245 [Candidatus Kaiserbacteria bacterium RIFCSPLOWO2_12_FULL_52_8]|nr:MAG: hypothetical protein A3G63_02245 [Candidatus Kaiserbacteria bacterium RIFCSPLOWO2_12_FULL_52_8]